MGLNIIVCKFYKPDTTTNKNKDYLFLHKSFPQWAKDLSTVRIDSVIDYEQYYNETNIDLLNLKQTKFYIDNNKDTHIIYKLKDEEIDIKLKDLPRKNIYRDVIYYKEVGFQRKGLNHKFYEDCDKKLIKSSYIWTLKELYEFKDKYCDEIKVIDGFTHYSKKDFQKNIIDNFEEGKCVVFLC